NTTPMAGMMYGEFSRVPVDVHVASRPRYWNAADRDSARKNTRPSKMTPSGSPRDTAVHATSYAFVFVSWRNGFQIDPALCAASATPWMPPHTTNPQLGPCHRPHRSMVIVMLVDMRRIGDGFDRVAISSGRNR